MKLSEIITRVQRQFGDDIQAQITREDIIRWVNDACLEIVVNNKTNQSSTTGTTPIVAGKSNYALPDDLYLLRAVRVNGRVLTATTYEQIVQEYGGDNSDYTIDGPPTQYWTHNKEVVVFPRPVEALGSVDILYVRTPTVLTVADLDASPDVPVQYHPRIVEYCIAQAAELDDDLSQYQLKMGQFNANLQKLQQNSENPEGDGFYPSITYTDSVGWDGAYAW